MCGQVVNALVRMGPPWGKELSSSDDKSKSDRRSSGGAGSPGASAAMPVRNGDMGTALRSVYQRTVDEQVPDEMLDLLGKLG